MTKAKTTAGFSPTIIAVGYFSRSDVPEPLDSGALRQHVLQSTCKIGMTDRLHFVFPEADVVHGNTTLLTLRGGIRIPIGTFNIPNETPGFCTYLEVTELKFPGVFPC